MRGWAGLLALVVVLTTALAAPVFAQGRTHVVQPGENLYRISLKYAVGVDELMRANGLLDPRQLRVGQVLLIPPSVTPAAGAITAGPYVVRRGDTLYSIARRSGVTVRALMAANQLTSEAIYVGQMLVVPGTVQKPVVSGPSQAVNPRDVVGMTLPAPRPLRVRRAPQTYGTTLVLVAADTPLRVLSYVTGWFAVRLPGGETGWVREEDLAPSARQPVQLPETIRTVEGRQIVAEAMRYLGTAYVWGGVSDRGVDCSGFVYVVFSAYLQGLPRMSSFDYYKMGFPLGRDELQPGDLVFFTTYAPGPSHVGIYLGDGRFIHASSSRRSVIITALNEPYYAARFLGGRRLTKP